MTTVGGDRVTDTTNRRVWRQALLGLGGATIASLGASGWYVADLIGKGALESGGEAAAFDLEVIGVADGAITLRAASGDGAWRIEGLWGVESANGYGRVGAIREIGDRTVVREFRPMQGSLAPRDRVRLDNFAFPPDPQRAFVLAYEETHVRTSLGAFPAWFVKGREGTWLIFVHGKGAERAESLRMLGVTSELGYPSLSITYRNDPGAPASADGRYRYGRDEWQEVEGAVRHALAQGARDVVLVGYSMGGGIVTNFLYQSPLAATVRGLVLDSPLLDLGATFRLRAQDRGLPQFMARIGQQIARARFGVDWGELDYLRRADELRVPILLFHGAADRVVPVATSEALAAARPDLVTYVRVAGAQHVRGWNLAPQRYEEAVRAFLGQVAPLR